MMIQRCNSCQSNWTNVQGVREKAHMILRIKIVQFAINEKLISVVE